MSHVHHDPAGHGHAHAHGHAHGQAPARRAHAAPELSGSMLRVSAAVRLGVAAAIVAVIWAAVIWAVS